MAKNRDLFKSPGVKIFEIDQSTLDPAPPAVGPLIIGSHNPVVSTPKHN